MVEISPNYLDHFAPFPPPPICTHVHPYFLPWSSSVCPMKCARINASKFTALAVNYRQHSFIAYDMPCNAILRLQHVRIVNLRSHLPNHKQCTVRIPATLIGSEICIVRQPLWVYDCFNAKRTERIGHHKKIYISASSSINYTLVILVVFIEVEGPWQPVQRKLICELY